MQRNSLALAVAFAGSVTLTMLASGRDTYEVWAIDQSNSAGTAFGGTVYIWDGHDLENRHGAVSAPAEKIDLAGAAAALCFASTGANPVRPHMLSINTSQTHAIISFVASGHVLFMDAAARLPVACFRMSPGVGGVFEALAPVSNVDANGVERADVHAMVLRRR